MTITSFLRVLAPLVLIFAGGARPAFSQVASDPCGADVEKFCKDVSLHISANVITQIGPS